MAHDLTPDILLKAYGIGVFPMAVSRTSPEIQWFDPENRGVFPLDRFHISRSLRKSILKADYQPRFNSNFEAVLAGCSDRSETWINPEIHGLYMALFENGHAHSQEIWHQGHLIGGVFGVTLGRAFFGESMFSTRRDASKIALAWLVDRLRRTGFSLFDTQFVTAHLQSLGAIEISRQSYQRHLELALQSRGDITQLATPQNAYDVIQCKTQTS